VKNGVQGKEAGEGVRQPGVRTSIGLGGWGEQRMRMEGGVDIDGEGRVGMEKAWTERV
jgi:hypothetical protein